MLRSDPYYHPIIARIEFTSGCWKWTGWRGRNGYGYISRGTRQPEQLAHRAIWEALRGTIPLGKQIDHLCRVRSCVRPDHLEAVTQRENLMRGNHPLAVLHRRNECIRDHALIQDNVYVRPNGTRTCRTCARMREGRRGPKGLRGA